MATQEETILAVIGAVASVLYFAVAAIQWKRPVSRQARPALISFVVWWAGLGLLGLFTLFFTFGPDIVEWGLAGVRAVIYVFFAIIMALCAGLVHYLLFLYTGRKEVLPIAIVFYAILFFMLVWMIEGFGPTIGIDPDSDTGDVEFYTTGDPPRWAGVVLGLGIVLPLLGSTVAYALLFFRTPDATGRYRIALVSAGLAMWFLFSTSGTVLRTITGDSDQSFASQLTSQILGVVAATLTLLAYDPPAPIQRRLGVRSVVDER